MLNNILIFRTDRVGDLIVTCPAIITIKEYLVNPKITFKNLGERRNKREFQGVRPQIHQIRQGKN